MSEANQIPELTLTPDLAAPAPALTVEATETVDAAAAAAELARRDANAVKLDESMLSPEEQKTVAEFAGKIDLRDTNVVLQYGAAAQKSIAGFSESALGQVRTKDLGQVGDALAGLVGELQNFGKQDKSGILEIGRAHV